MVYDHQRGGKPAEIRATFGELVRHSLRATHVDTTAQWVETAHRRDPESRFDYGVVVLPQDHAHAVHALPVEPDDNDALAAMSLNVAGYPAKPPAPHAVGELFGARSRPLPNDGRPDRIYYPINTWAGMSGGPVYNYDEQADTRTIRGIHTSFVRGLGSAVQVTEEVQNLIDLWLSRFET